jgi:phosphate transport system substrate-binding protein
MIRNLWPAHVGLCVAIAFAAPACTRGTGADGGSAPASAVPTSGRVTVDGSTTVLPVSRKMAEEFQHAHPGVQVAVESSGTGGGFKKFCAGGVDIAGASRPIDAEEARACEGNHVDYIELPVGFDSLTVVVNPKNGFVGCLTVAELKKLWEPAAEGKVTQWNQVRASFPSERITLYGPGSEHGTFDYFTLAIVGTSRQSRNDYTKNDDGQVLANDVASDVNALGFFGAAYYLANRDKLKLVGIDNGQGCVLPGPETVENTTYQPLSRPLFIYLSKTAAARPDASAFARYFVAPENSHFLREVGYVPLSPASLLIASRRIDDTQTGSMFKGRGAVVGVPLNFFEDEDRIKNALVQ